MKEFDYILIYEHKVREIENLILLKIELQKRGYSVLIKNYYELEFVTVRRYRYHAKVLVCFMGYNTDSIKMCVQELIKFDKFIDLQWEQLISKEQEVKGSFRNFSGLGKYVVHISWGKANYERLLNNANIDRKNLILCGNMGLDFFNKQFDKYYLSREEILKMFDIPIDRKVCILFSSFKGVGDTKERLDAMIQKFGKNRLELVKVAEKSLDIILEWIRSVLRSDDNIFFIYRPHPGENSELVAERMKQFSNFKIISDLSARQWILVSDIMFSWASTVAAEAYYANRICYPVEPIEIADSQKTRAFDSVKPIKNYQTFHSVIMGEKYDTCMSEKELEEYYGYDRTKCSYIRLADAFETVIHDNQYLLYNEIEREKIYFYEKKGIKGKLIQISLVEWIYWKLLALSYPICKMLKIEPEYFKGYFLLVDRIPANVATKREMKAIEQRIRKCLECDGVDR